MADLQTIVPVGLISAAATYGGQAIVTWIRTRGERADKKEAAAVDLSKAKDEFVAEVIGLARGEVAAARIEMAGLREQIEKLRPLEQNFYELEQALDHIEALMTSNPAERAVAERAAKAFFNRMKRTADARGNLVNEAQRLLSGLREGEHKIEDVAKGTEGAT